MNKDILEQPQMATPCDQGADAQQDLGHDSEQLGSNNLGKFKDAESLLKAYNNLQSEFTKKCQTLSQLSKELEDNKLNSSLPTKLDQIDSALDEFLSAHQNLLDAKQDIKELISLEDKPIDELINSAVFKFVLDKYKNPMDLSSDKDFLKNYIYSNKDIQHDMVQQYFDNINIDKAPQVIANHKGSSSIVTPKTKPKDLKEAGYLVREMFKTQGD